MSGWLLGGEGWVVYYLKVYRIGLGLDCLCSCVRLCMCVENGTFPCRYAYVYFPMFRYVIVFPRVVCDDPGFYVSSVGN